LIAASLSGLAQSLGARVGICSMAARQLREAGGPEHVGDDVDARDTAHDQLCRSEVTTETVYADPVRRHMLSVESDRLIEWRSHPHAARDPPRAGHVGGGLRPLTRLTFTPDAKELITVTESTDEKNDPLAEMTGLNPWAPIKELAHPQDRARPAPGLPPPRRPHPRPRHLVLARPAPGPHHRDHHRPHLAPPARPPRRTAPGHVDRNGRHLPATHRTDQTAA
jgi:hypothetical protein